VGWDFTDHCRADPFLMQTSGWRGKHAKVVAQNRHRTEHRAVPHTFALMSVMLEPRFLIRVMPHVAEIA
jgi:hypothetical protein